MPVTMRCLSQIGLSKILVITAQNPFIAVRPVTTIKAAFNHALVPVMPIMLTDVTVSVPPSPNTGIRNYAEIIDTFHFLKHASILYF